MKAVTYLRVSTKSQGQSGLGVEAQRELIDRFLQSKSGTLIHEYVETVSGAKNERAVLQKAIAHTKSINGTLVIAKLDRISRSVSFISSLMETGIDFKVAEMPDATHFQLHIYAALAQEERRLISERTKAALKAAKARGVSLGKSSKALAQKNRRLADDFVQKVAGQIIEPRNNGLSFSQIARNLNGNNVESYNGGIWHAMTVKRAYERLERIG